MKSAVLIVAVVLLIRVPFLNQAIQGDDVYYLAAATHAQIEPAHPNHVHYIFEGRDVDFRGYPHPPLNAWCLAALIAVIGGVSEIPFHTAYIAFSLIAAFSVWSLAKRFSPNPLAATLLFLATPAFVINGNSFESDVPFLAFWLAGFAFFVWGKNIFAALALGLAALAAPQALFAIPILAVYDRRRWPVYMVPLFVFAGWQFFEYYTDGRFPFAVAAGYQQSYGLQRLAMKLRNAAALSIHALFLVCPILLPQLFRNRIRFLYAWCVIFFLGALALFFAGSARYLLPITAPVAILASTASPLLLRIGFVASLSLSLLLATANFQHWNQTRAFARSIPADKRIWVNAEWGLRHYLEEQGALPVLEGQQIPPGDLVVSSELAFPVTYSHAGSASVITRQVEVRPSVPLRLIGLDSHSGYSTVAKGFLPFGISNGVLDRLRIETLVPKLPTREYVDLALPAAAEQLASGIYAADGNPWRWTAKSATILLKAPSSPTPIAVRLYIPDAAKARTVTLTLDTHQIASQTFPGPGTYTMNTPPVNGSVMTITVDQTFSTAADHRELGIILSGAGFVAPAHGQEN